MIGDIRQHLKQPQFRVFTIHMADGRNFDVPTEDHVTITSARAYIYHDDDSFDILSGLLMAGLTIHAPASPASGGKGHQP